MALKTQHYVRWLFGALLATLLAAMAFNAVIDQFLSTTPTLGDRA